MARQLRLGRIIVFFLVIMGLFMSGRFFCSSNNEEEPILVTQTEKTIPPLSEKEEIKEEIILGFIGPLSGQRKEEGEAAKNGVALAVAEMNKAGGVDGKHIILLYEDGACSATTTTTAFSRLADKVTIIVGPVCSEEMLALGLIADQKKVVVLGLAASSPDITDAGDSIFRLWPSDEYLGKVLAEQIQKRGLQNSSVIFSNTDYAIAVKNAFKTRANELGITIVDEFVDEGENRTVTDAQAVFIAADDANVGLRIKTTLPVFATESVAKARNGTYATYQLDETKQQTKDFLEKYTTKYGTTQFPLIAANAYDAMKLIGEGLGKGSEKETLKAYLYSIKDWSGASGTLTIDKNGDAIREFMIRD